MKHNYLEKVIHGIFVFLIMVCLAIPVNVYADTYVLFVVAWENAHPVLD